LGETGETLDLLKKGDRGRYKRRVHLNFTMAKSTKKTKRRKEKGKRGSWKERNRTYAPRLGEIRKERNPSLYTKTRA